MDPSINALLVNMTSNMNNELPKSSDRTESFILISNSTFVNLGYSDVLSHIGMLQYPTSDLGVMYDASV